MAALLKDTVDVLNTLGAGGWVFCLGPPVVSFALLRVTKMMLIPLLSWFGICVAVAVGYYIAPMDASGENQGYVLTVLMLLVLNWTTFGLVILGTAVVRLVEGRERAPAEPSALASTD